jgi:hypothetical protein
MRYILIILFSLLSVATWAQNPNPLAYAYKTMNEAIHRKMNAESIVQVSETGNEGTYIVKLRSEGYTPNGGTIRAMADSIKALVLISVGAIIENGDTTIFSAVIDSTSNTNNKVLVARNGKISSDTRFLWNFTTHKLSIGTTNGARGGSVKLYVEGNAMASAFIRNGGAANQFLKADGSIDTTHYVKSVKVNGADHFPDTANGKVDLGTIAGGGFNLGWYNVVDYGADTTGTTDATTAIQAAINDCFAHGGGTVYFRRGKYLVSGANKTSDGAGATINSAQLYFPFVGYDSTKSAVTIRLLGEQAANGMVSDYTSTQTGTVKNGAVLISNSRALTGSVIGVAYKSGYAGTFSFIKPEIQDLRVIVCSKTAGGTDTAVTMSGINLSDAAMASVINTQVNTGSTFGNTVQPAPGAYGIRFPKINNWAHVFGLNLYVQGFYTGYQVSEHFNGTDIKASVCYNGIEYAAGLHDSYIDHLTIHSTKYNILVSGSGSFHIAEYDMEDQNTGTHWWDNTADIYEPTLTNSFGSIMSYTRVIAFAGVRNYGFVNNTLSPYITINSITQPLAYNLKSNYIAQPLYATQNGDTLAALDFSKVSFNANSFSGRKKDSYIRIPGNNGGFLYFTQSQAGTLKGVDITSDSFDVRLGATAITSGNQVGAQLTLGGNAGTFLGDGYFDAGNSGTNGRLLLRTGTQNTRLQIEKTGEAEFTNSLGVGLAAGTLPSYRLHVIANQGSPSFASAFFDNTNGTANRLAVNHASNTGVGYYIGSVIKWSESVTNGFGSSNPDFILHNDVTNNDVFSIDGNTNFIGASVGSATAPNSTFQVGGSLSLAYRAITASRTLDATDYTINCTANSFTVTLPTAVGITGRVYVIKNTGAGTITIATTSTQTIDNTTPGTVAAGALLRVQSTGANWISL